MNVRGGPGGGEVAGWARPPAALIHQGRVRALSLSLLPAAADPSITAATSTQQQPAREAGEKMLFWPLLAALYRHHLGTLGPGLVLMWRLLQSFSVSVSGPRLQLHYSAA